MRIVILAETFSKRMGYIEGMLARNLARLGADVHVLTTEMLPYQRQPDDRDALHAFLETEKRVPGTTEDYDGYTLHVLPHRFVLGYPRMSGLYRILQTIQPDIVQVSNVIGWLALDAALLSRVLGYHLFTGNHRTASTFPLATSQRSPWSRARVHCFLTRTIPGRIISYFCSKCYAVTIDCAYIAERFFGVQKRKIEVMHLGVDTDIFFPLSLTDDGNERYSVRESLGIADSDIVCVYSGKFTETKNPAIIARAIDAMRSLGYAYTALFIGHGVQCSKLELSPHSIVLPFMPFSELGRYYRAADIGVWPTNESTSMLDAAACGIPLIVSDGIAYREHIDGNGIVYRMNDEGSLIDALMSLADSDLRQQLGEMGAQKMAGGFSWLNVARRRLADYDQALRRIQ